MAEKKKSSSQPTSPVASDLLTDEQAARILSVEPRTLRLWRNSRGLPFIRITSKVIRYRLADLNQWLAERRVAIRGIL
jgi:DNA-binding transcriptional MerR regulator